MSDLVARQGEHVFYTWTAQKSAVGLEITGGRGARFDTADGARWWDLASQTWNANLGHGHPRMQQALAEAAGRGLVAAPTAVFRDKARAGELLTAVAPRGLTKTFICLSGAEANENAIKMARLFTGRKKVVARSRSYHGATLAMLSLSGDPRREAFEPGLPGIVRMGDPYCYRCQFGQERATCHLECADDLERALLAEGPDTVAAVVLEGITGANGVFVPKPGYFRRIRELCDRHGVMLIADEVLSGFGRTGKWFAVDHDGVVPDLMTCAKGITGGYAPGGAVLVSEKVARFFDDHVLSCGLTTYAHPLVCAAIVAAIECYRDEQLVEQAAARGEQLQARLPGLLEKRRYVGEARGLGLLWCLELVEPGTRTALAPAQMLKVAEAVRARHLLMHKRDNLLYIAPPLVIGQSELDQAVDEVFAALDSVLA